MPALLSHSSPFPSLAFLSPNKDLASQISRDSFQLATHQSQPRHFLSADVAAQLSTLSSSVMQPPSGGRQQPPNQSNTQQQQQQQQRYHHQQQPQYAAHAYGYGASGSSPRTPSTYAVSSSSQLNSMFATAADSMMPGSGFAGGFASPAPTSSQYGEASGSNSGSHWSRRLSHPVQSPASQGQSVAPDPSEGQFEDSTDGADDPIWLRRVKRSSYGGVAPKAGAGEVQRGLSFSDDAPDASVTHQDLPLLSLKDWSTPHASQAQVDGVGTPGFRSAISSFLKGSPSQGGTGMTPPNLDLTPKSQAQLSAAWMRSSEAPAGGLPATLDVSSLNDSSFMEEQAKMFNSLYGITSGGSQLQSSGLSFQPGFISDESRATTSTSTTTSTGHRGPVRPSAFFDREGSGQYASSATSYDTSSSAGTSGSGSELHAELDQLMARQLKDHAEAMSQAPYPAALGLPAIAPSGATGAARSRSISMSSTGTVRSNGSSKRKSISEEQEDTDPAASRKMKRKVAKDGRFPCPVQGCDKTFSTSGHATRHSHSHIEQRPFICPHPGCDATFSRRDNSNQHQRAKHRKVLEAQRATDEQMLRLG